MESLAEGSASTAPAEKIIHRETAELEHLQMSRQADSPRAELSPQSWDVSWRKNPTQVILVVRLQTSSSLTQPRPGRGLPTNFMAEDPRAIGDDAGEGSEQPQP